MSRRDSRVSVTARQNDALVEFENFKKKFLLANKHITKLNSTLSVRIEELNAQISTLYVENLRLRASEIALAAQLKKEREKSHKLLAETEAATLNFTKHINFLRHSFHIDPAFGQAPAPDFPPRRAHRPVHPSNPTVSPSTARLSRPPNFPGIHEDDEGCSSSERACDSPSPALRRTAKNKVPSSASRLPLPARALSPPPVDPISQGTPHINLENGHGKTGKRKPSRRQSGLLSVNGDFSSADAGLMPPRPPSPAFGSPVRREAGLAEEEEEIAVISGTRDIAVNMDEFDGAAPKVKKIKKGKTREIEREDDDAGGESSNTMSSGRSRDRERGREREKKLNKDEEDIASGAKLRLKDVTNSPRKNTDLPPLDTNHIAHDHDRDEIPTSPSETPSSAISASSSLAGVRTFLSTPATTPAPTPAPIVTSAQLPTPRPSCSPVPPATDSEAEAAAIGGRESRRTRKSVNYAEPKLNTKMRKPDPPPGTTLAPRKRSSAAGSTAAVVTAAQSSDDGGTRSSTEVTVLSTATLKRKKSRPRLPLPDSAEESEGEQADAEFAVRRHAWVNVDGRRRSVQASTLTSARKPEGSLEGDETRRRSMAV